MFKVLSGVVKPEQDVSGVVEHEYAETTVCRTVVKRGFPNDFKAEISRYSFLLGLFSFLLGNRVNIIVVCGESFGTDISRNTFDNRVEIVRISRFEAVAPDRFFVVHVIQFERCNDVLAKTREFSNDELGAVLLNRYFIDRFVVSCFYRIVFGVIDQNIAPILINVSVHELFGCNAEVFVDADHAERS